MTSGAIKPTRSTHLRPTAQPHTAQPRPTAQPHTAQPHTAPHRRVGCHVSQGAVSCVPRTSQPPHTMHGTLLSNSHHPREGLLRPSSTSHTTLAAGGRVGGAGGGGRGPGCRSGCRLQHGGEDGRNFRGHARSKDGVHCAERREDREFLALGLRQPVAVSGRRRRRQAIIIQRSASQTATDDAAAALRCGGGVSLSLSLSLTSGGRWARRDPPRTDA
jgi:hypothetical protein